MPSQPLNTQPVIISFSGIDGAGKSTQILALESWLREAGLRVLVLTMWDDVVAFSRFRETASKYAFGGDQGIGTPERPLRRRDKNVTASPLTVARIGLYFADAVSLAARIARLRKNRGYDVVIFDRFIYDELANLPLDHKWVRGVARLLLKIVPKIDIGFVVDASPETAHARKPEYDLEFVRRNRQAYLAVAEAADLFVVKAGSAAEMEDGIRTHFCSKVPLRRGISADAAPTAACGPDPIATSS